MCVCVCVYERERERERERRAKDGERVGGKENTRNNLTYLGVNIFNTFFSVCVCVHNSLRANANAFVAEKSFGILNAKKELV